MDSTRRPTAAVAIRTRTTISLMSLFASEETKFPLGAVVVAFMILGNFQEIKWIFLAIIDRLGK
jgi:hypothetical protein